MTLCHCVRYHWTLCLVRRKTVESETAARYVSHRGRGINNTPFHTTQVSRVGSGPGPGSTPPSTHVRDRTTAHRGVDAIGRDDLKTAPTRGTHTTQGSEEGEGGCGEEKRAGGGGTRSALAPLHLSPAVASGAPLGATGGAPVRRACSPWGGCKTCPRPAQTSRSRLAARN